MKCGGLENDSIIEEGKSVQAIRKNQFHQLLILWLERVIPSLAYLADRSVLLPRIKNTLSSTRH